jgi:hypothetical protein
MKPRNLAAAVFLFFSARSLAVTMTPTLMDGSPAYPAGQSFAGVTQVFVSESADPLKPFSGEAVMFKGNQAGGKNLVYRYRLDFDHNVKINKIEIAGAAWYGCAGGAIRLLNKDNALLGMALPPAIGNSFQSVTLLPAISVSSNSFFLEEDDCNTTWRYRARIAVDFLLMSYEYSDIAGIPDINGDGILDQAVLTMKAGSHYLQTIDSATGSQIKQLSLGPAALITPRALTSVGQQISVLIDTKSTAVTTLRLYNAATLSLVKTLMLAK